MLRSEPLDELTVTVVVDNETDTLSSVDAGVPQLPELVALLARTPAMAEHAGHPCVTVFDQLCVACHGLSLLVTARRGTRRDSVLFDAGPDAGVWLDNARRLDVDLAAIDTVFLSHWHWDHSGALPEVVAAITAARRVVGLDGPIVDVHPDRPDQRGVMTPSGTLALLPPEPSLEELGEAGGRVESHGDAHLLAGGAILASGHIPRVTSYETGLPSHHSITGGEVVADPLIADERLLAALVGGRGVTVMSACSHAGIVNACLAARAHFPDAPVDLVVGGYHLAGGAVEGRIDATVGDLHDLVEPRIVAPAHCTGWRARAALAVRFAPGRYGPAAVGTRYALASEIPKMG